MSQKVFIRKLGTLVELDDEVDPDEYIHGMDCPEYVVTCPCGCEVTFGVN